MRTIQTLNTSIWSEPDEQRRAYKIGQANSKTVFEQLQNHLEQQGLLPDEYFHMSDDFADEMPENMERILCIPSFGASEGVYLNISIVVYNEQGEQGFISFATGKILGSTADDFLRMSRIAAECSLMLNNGGCDMYQKKNVELVLTEEEALVLGNAATLGYQKMGLDVLPTLSSILKKLPVDPALEHLAASSTEDQLIKTIKNASLQDRLLLAEKLENDNFTAAFVNPEMGWFGINDGETKIVNGIIDALKNKSDINELITALHRSSQYDRHSVSLKLCSCFHIEFVSYDILDGLTLSSPAVDMRIGEQQIVNVLLKALDDVNEVMKEQQDKVIARGCVLIFENAALHDRIGLEHLMKNFLPYDFQNVSTLGEYNTMKAIMDALKTPPIKPGDNLGIVFPTAFVEDREKAIALLEDIMDVCAYYDPSEKMLNMTDGERALAKEIVSSLKNVNAHERKHAAAKITPSIGHHVKVSDLLEGVEHPIDPHDEERLLPWEI